VKIAFASYDAHAVRNLPYAAGYATAFGLPHDEALKAITLNPAEIWVWRTSWARSMWERRQRGGRRRRSSGRQDGCEKDFIAGRQSR